MVCDIFQLALEVKQKAPAVAASARVIESPSKHSVDELTDMKEKVRVLPQYYKCSKPSFQFPTPSAPTQAKATQYAFLGAFEALTGHRLNPP